MRAMASRFTPEPEWKRCCTRRKQRTESPNALRGMILPNTENAMFAYKSETMRSMRSEPLRMFTAGLNVATVSPRFTVSTISSYSLSMTACTSLPSARERPGSPASHSWNSWKYTSGCMVESST